MWPFRRKEKPTPVAWVIQHRILDTFACVRPAPGNETVVAFTRRVVRAEQFYTRDEADVFVRVNKLTEVVVRGLILQEGA